MMTTMAALMGTLPIALGHGAGAESRRPSGIAVVGGLLFSQLITLYITPVVYTYLDALQQRLARAEGQGAEGAPRAAARARQQQEPPDEAAPISPPWTSGPTRRRCRPQGWRGKPRSRRK